VDGLASWPFIVIFNPFRAIANQRKEKSRLDLDLEKTKR